MNAVIAPGGWCSSLLTHHGVPHYFSWKDPPRDSEIATALAGGGALPARVRQVHGARCVTGQACAEVPRPNADAIHSSDPTLVPMVTTADCTSVLIWCPGSRTVAAVHAGWRGLVADVIGETIRAMTAATSADPKEMIAAVGPCASAERYEVGSEVIDAFTATGLANCLRVSATPGKACADCSLAAYHRLVAAGLDPRHVERSPICTIGDPRFASHRREPNNPARMLAAIAIPT